MKVEVNGQKFHLSEGFNTRPTREALRISALERYSILNGVKFKDWDMSFLLNETLRTDFCYVDSACAELAINGDKKAAEELTTIITYFIQDLPYDKYFVKLESRSPKDYTTSPLHTAQEIVDALLSSFRTSEDLCHLTLVKDKLAIIFRPFVEILPKDEFRVFIKNSQIVGISQYFYTEKFEYDDIKKIEKEIREYVEQKVILSVPASNYIADIVYYKDRWICLETNPWGYSDPCLFENYRSFDNTLRYNK